MYDVFNNPKDYYLGLPVIMPLDRLDLRYLARIHELLNVCLAEHPRWTVIRVDLHSPAGCSVPQRAVTRFIESLKAQLEYAWQAKGEAGKRGYPPLLRYVWVREQANSPQPHYHLALLLNRDAYYSVGDYGRLSALDLNYDVMLAGRIHKAWGIALGLDWKQARAGVHFPRHPSSALIRTGLDFERQFQGVFFRLSYFAKLETKLQGDGLRNFGMSQIGVIQGVPGSPIPWV